MKFYLFLLAIFGLTLATPAYAEVIGGEKFSKIIYLSSANKSPSPSANNNGRDYNSAKPLIDGNLLAIPANVVITKVFVVVDTAVTGLTAFNIGDTDDSDGYIASSAPTGAPERIDTTGLKYWDVAYQGAYLKGDIIVTGHALAKYYGATGKYLTLDVTGTSTDGKMRVFVEGYAVGRSGL